MPYRIGFGAGGRTISPQLLEQRWSSAGAALEQRWSSAGPVLLCHFLGRSKPFAPNLICGGLACKELLERLGPALLEHHNEKNSGKKFDKRGSCPVGETREFTEEL